MMIVMTISGFFDKYYLSLFQFESTNFKTNLQHVRINNAAIKTTILQTAAPATAAAAGGGGGGGGAGGAGGAGAEGRAGSMVVFFWFHPCSCTIPIHIIPTMVYGSYNQKKTKTMHT